MNATAGSNPSHVRNPSVFAFSLIHFHSDLCSIHFWHIVFPQYHSQIIQECFKIHLLKNILFIYFLEREEGREKEKERNSDVREKHRLVASRMHTIRGLNLQPRHVPWLGTKPATFSFVRWCPTNWATPVRTTLFIFIAHIESNTLFPFNIADIH